MFELPFRTFMLNRRATCVALLCLATLSSYALLYRVESDWKVLSNTDSRIRGWEKQDGVLFTTSHTIATESDETTAITFSTTAGLHSTKVVQNFHRVDVEPSNLPFHIRAKAAQLPDVNLNKTVKVFVHRTSSIAVNNHTKEPPASKHNVAQMVNNTKMVPVPHSQGMFILPKRYAIDKVGFKRYKDYLTQVEKPLPYQNKAVIIITNYRSGSSFFGELFNQHPDAFYSFENLVPLSNSSECFRHTDLKLRVIMDLIRCQLPDWIEIYKGIPLSEQVRRNKNVLQCMRTKMCFRQNTKEMCEDRHCPRNATGVKKPINCQTDCGALNRILVDNECRRKQMVVLKLIRLCDITLLEKIFKTSSADIKILHLIRDPRAIANSRQLISRRINLKESLRNTCNRQSHNMIHAIVNTPDWLKGRYKIFRYEDAALFPYAVAQSVYEFVGLSFPESMKLWIANNTNIEIPKNYDYLSTDDLNGKERQKREINAKKQTAKYPLKRVKVQPIKKVFSDPYGTKRNSTNIVQKWASRLPYSTVLFIEGICARVMEMAGYKKVGTYEQYKVKGNTTYFSDEIEILKQFKIT